MNTKKIFGYIFIAISIILGIVLLGQLANIIGTIGGIIQIFNGQLEDYQIGQTIGKFIYWIIHISLIIFLLIIGKYWAKKTV